MSMTAHEKLWSGRYADALKRDDDAAMAHIDEAWQRSYDLAAEELDEATTPEAVWNGRRAAITLTLLDGESTQTPLLPEEELAGVENVEWDGYDHDPGSR